MPCRKRSIIPAHISSCRARNSRHRTATMHASRSAVAEPGAGPAHARLAASDEASTSIEPELPDPHPDPSLQPDSSRAVCHATRVGLPPPASPRSPHPAVRGRGTSPNAACLTTAVGASTASRCSVGATLLDRRGDDVASSTCPDPEVPGRPDCAGTTSAGAAAGTEMAGGALPPSRPRGPAGSLNDVPSSE